MSESSAKPQQDKIGNAVTVLLNPLSWVFIAGVTFLIFTLKPEKSTSTSEATTTNASESEQESIIESATQWLTDNALQLAMTAIAASTLIIVGVGLWRTIKGGGKFTVIVIYILGSLGLAIAIFYLALQLLFPDDVKRNRIMESYREKVAAIVSPEQTLGTTKNTNSGITRTIVGGQAHTEVRPTNCPTTKRFLWNAPVAGQTIKVVVNGSIGQMSYIWEPSTTVPQPLYNGVPTDVTMTLLGKGVTSVNFYCT